MKKTLEIIEYTCKNRIEISRDIEFHEVSVPNTLIDWSQGEKEVKMVEKGDQDNQPENKIVLIPVERSGNNTAT